MNQIPTEDQGEEIEVTKLPDGYKALKPIPAIITKDSGVYAVKDKTIGLITKGFGNSREEAINEFGSMLIDQYEILQGEKCVGLAKSVRTNLKKYIEKE